MSKVERRKLLTSCPLASIIRPRSPLAARTLNLRKCISIEPTLQIAAPKLMLLREKEAWRKSLLLLSLGGGKWSG